MTNAQPFFFVIDRETQTNESSKFAEPVLFVFFPAQEKGQGDAASRDRIFNRLNAN